MKHAIKGSHRVTSEDILQKIIDAFPSEVMIVDSRGIIKLMSRTMRREFQCVRVGKDCLLDYILDEGSSLVKSAVQNFLLSDPEGSTKGDQNEIIDKYFKFSLLDSDRTTHPYSMVINPTTQLENSLLPCFSVTFTRAGSENVISTVDSYLHSQYLEMIFENTSDAIFLAPISDEGVHGNFIEVNFEACLRLGYAKEELLRLNARTINPVANANRVKVYAELLLKDGAAIFEAIHVAKNGDHIPVEVHATIVKEGLQKYVLSVVKDIRLMKKSEDHQALFGRLMDYSWNEIYIIDSRSLSIKVANEGALKNLGVKKVDLNQYKFTDFLVNTTAEQFLDFSHELFSGDLSQLIYESKLRRLNGSVYPVEVRLQLSQSEVPPLLFANVQDISERKKIERRLTYLASYDSLTGLPNRTLYVDRLNVAMEACKRQENFLAVMFIDLDGFKQVNDTHGHEVGDLLVREVAKRLVKSTRKSDTIARFGGDEFTVILNNINNIDGVDVVVSKMISNITQPFLLNGQEVVTSLSVGITIYPFNDNDDASELIRQADIAMYSVKRDGKRGAAYYSYSMSEAEVRRNSVESAVVNVLKRRELELFFQPRVSLRDGSIVGAEVLLRWQSPHLGFVSPVEFIPVMEKLGVIIEVGEWVMRQSCLQLRKWLDMGFDFRLSVNVSAKQFAGGQLHKLIIGILHETNVPADHLEIEITEGILIDQSDDAAVSLESLSELGVLVSLDDFGTGYSSLSYLKQFPIDILKIDRSFIMDLQQNKDSLVIVEAIIGLAKKLDLSVTAEGIEEKWHADFLTSHDCDEGQGYYFARPMPRDEMEAILEKSRICGLPIKPEK